MGEYESNSRLNEARKSEETLQFLYDKRLTLYNTRRDHEWKIFFGGIAFLGAADAAIVTGQVALSTILIRSWIGACVLVFVLVIGYEVELQNRNTSDRRAMSLLQNMLCDSLHLPLDSIAREACGSAYNDASRLWFGIRWVKKYGWAFRWQVPFLALCVAASTITPLITRKDKHAEPPIIVNVQPPSVSVSVPTAADVVEPSHQRHNLEKRVSK